MSLHFVLTGSGEGFQPPCCFLHSEEYCPLVVICEHAKSSCGELVVLLYVPMVVASTHIQFTVYSAAGAHAKSHPN